MSGEGSTPAAYNPDIFSGLRIKVAPVVCLTGYLINIFCLLYTSISMGIVFSATITGFYLKQQMQKKKINHYITFIVSAFVASPP